MEISYLRSSALSGRVESGPLIELEGDDRCLKGLLKDYGFWWLAVMLHWLSVFFSSSLSDGIQRGLIWILGHSYVFLGERRADMRPNGRQLGISREEACIRWIGRPGMQWARVLPEVQHFACIDRPPDVLVLHVGGNDLGGHPIRELIKDVEIDFLRLRTSFPEMLIICSDIVARTTWRLARSVDRLNKARIKVNKRVGQFVI